MRYQQEQMEQNQVHEKMKIQVADLHTDLQSATRRAENSARQVVAIQERNIQLLEDLERTRMLDPLLKVSSR